MGKLVLLFYTSRIIERRVISLQLDINLLFEVILDFLFRISFHLILLQPNRCCNIGT
jgi:hypothetical protein